MKKNLKKMSNAHCSFIIIFYKSKYSIKPYHTAINGYVAKDYSDVDYYAHTANCSGADKKHTLKTFFRSCPNEMVKCYKIR